MRHGRQPPRASSTTWLRLEVVRSRIHGYGLVARRRFAAGELICYGDGVLWRDEEEFDDTYALILETVDVADGEVAPPGP